LRASSVPAFFPSVKAAFFAASNSASVKVGSGGTSAAIFSAISFA
jgi:hypothetical protein